MHHIYCVTPLYNDWTSCAILIKRIKELESSGNYKFTIIVVNDGSTIDAEDEVKKVFENVKILGLKVNVGHQRAIAVGIQYVYNEVKDADTVIVLDSDGEDRPQDIPALIEKSRDTGRIVFAKRKKRQESVVFKTGYFIYKHLFRLLTGQSISFGNYSAIPVSKLKKVANLNNIWNHYSGAIIHSRLPYDTVLLDRGKRYSGTSKMNFTSLVLHGLSSIAVYFDHLSVRILKFSLYGIGVCFLGISYILYQKLFTDNAVPGWASSLILIIMGIALQLFMVTLIVLLLQLSSRKNIDSPNAKRYLDFIEDENSKQD